LAAGGVGRAFRGSFGGSERTWTSTPLARSSRRRSARQFM
jgi:hypothetical protein